MKKYTIKTDQDLPVPDCRPGARYRFPFPTLEIGKCFIIVGMKRNVLGPYKRYSEKHLEGNRRFITKTISEGVAVWRIR